MARLFISYNRKEAAYAFAIRQWLMEDQGWASDDIFVDASHLHAGTEWEKKLLAEAEAAEVMLFLASDHSLNIDSFCYRELKHATGQILTVTIGGISPNDDRLHRALPDHAESRQITALDQQPTRPFPFVSPIDNTNGSAQLNPAQVEGIGKTLRELGVAPNSFSWTAKPEGPFPGLRPLSEGDEAIFCGRDLEIRDGLKAISDLRATVTKRALIIQAPSGAGKSSFLRAGLWHRLRRNQGFTPLGIIRAQKGAIRNEEWGLLTALHDTLTVRSPALGTKLGLTRDDLASRAASDLAGLLAAFADADAGDAGRRTLLLGFDQAEEMTALTPEDDAELDGLLQSLLSLPKELDLRLLLTARDDSVDATLARLAKAGLPQEQVETWRLHRLPVIRFDDIITGPAAAANQAGWKLTLDPALVDSLVAAAGGGAHAEGGDALPVLALALQRMVSKRRRPDGRINLPPGVAKAFLESAVADATTEALRTAKASDEDLRRLIIPCLATWDPDAGSDGAAKRQVAEADGLFAGDRAGLRVLADALVDQRLLTRSQTESGAAYEVAHEALLRVEPLGTLIYECREKFEQVRMLKVESREWHSSVHDTGMLGRSGERLITALKLLADPDFGPALVDVQGYLHQCEIHERSEDHKRRRILGRAFVKPAREALDKGLHDHALRLAAAAAVLAEDLDRKLVPEWWEPAARAMFLNRTTAVLAGHQGPVTFAAWSPDGRRVASASEDKTARIWEVSSGALLATLEGHGGGVNGAAWSPDGSRVVSASRDKTARIWEATSGVLLATLKGHGGWVNSAAWSPDGSRVVSASRDKTARIWEAASGALLATLEGHGDWVNSAAWSPDGNRVVSASKDGTARIWEAASGALLATLVGHDDAVNCAAWSADGCRVVSASDVDDLNVRIWDGASGTLLAVLEGHRDRVTSSTWSPDGRRILSSSDDKTARIWDATSGLLLAILSGHDGGVSTAAWSPDGNRVVSAAADRTARIWDATSGSLLATLSGHEDEVGAAAWSADGRRVLSAARDGTARIWEAQSEPLVAAWNDDEQVHECKPFSPDGSRICMRIGDGSLDIREILSGELVARVEHYRSLVVFYLAWAPDGSRFLIVSSDGGGRIWTAEDGTLVATLDARPEDVMRAEWSPDGIRVLSACDDGTLRIWEAATGARLATLGGGEDQVIEDSWSPDRGRIVTSTANGTARVWNVANGALLSTLNGHTDYVSSASFSSDNHLVLTTSEDGTARLWDSTTGVLLANLQTQGCDLTTAAISPNGNRILTRSDFGSLQIWEAPSGALIANLETPHDDLLDEELLQAEFSPDGSQILACISHGTAQIWDAQTGSLSSILGSHGPEVTSAAWSPTGSRILTTSDDGALQIWASRNGVRLMSVLKGNDFRNVDAQWSSDGNLVICMIDDYEPWFYDVSRTAIVDRAPAICLAAALACGGQGRQTESEATDLLMQDAPDDLYKAVMAQLGPEREAEVKEVAAALRAPLHPNCYLTPTQFAQKFGLRITDRGVAKPEPVDAKEELIGKPPLENGEESCAVQEEGKGDAKSGSSSAVSSVGVVRKGLPTTWVCILLLLVAALSVVGTLIITGVGLINPGTMVGRILELFKH